VLVIISHVTVPPTGTGNEGSGHDDELNAFVGAHMKANLKSTRQHAIAAVRHTTAGARAYKQSRDKRLVSSARRGKSSSLPRLSCGVPSLLLNASKVRCVGRVAAALVVGDLRIGADWTPPHCLIAGRRCLGRDQFGWRLTLLHPLFECS
jgi:hypothetical protein